MDKLGREKKSRLQLQPLINWITRPYATLGKGSRVDLFNFPVYALESQSAYWCTHRTWHLTTQSLSTVWHTSFPEIWPQPNSHNPSQTFHNGLIRDKIFCLILVTAANLLSLESIFEKSNLSDSLKEHCYFSRYYDEICLHLKLWDCIPWARYNVRINCYQICNCFFS